MFTHVNTSALNFTNWVMSPNVLPSGLDSMFFWSAHNIDTVGDMSGFNFKNATSLGTFANSYALYPAPAGGFTQAVYDHILTVMYDQIDEMQDNVFYAAGLTAYTNSGTPKLCHDALVAKGWTFEDGGGI